MLFIHAGNKGRESGSSGGPVGIKSSLNGGGYEGMNSLESEMDEDEEEVATEDTA